ncbi:SsrA-binding protein SmpB [Sutterella sp.]|uniref:SsrA-binding protein SmpB n=1 Tax=Sutterella sp. TaxID=1981025 RepID=UPI0025ECE7E4|nr:SsrA-binding protein SmpB [uncultured Sutterella sp.]
MAKNNPKDQKAKASATPKVLNKRATYDYSIEERFEAGIVLAGWEVKSVRAGRAQINLSHIYIRNGELFLCNAHMNPADQVCTHETLETNRTRKLLMHRREIMKLIGRVERQGYTLVPLNLHFKNGRVKVDLALARGKREFEKRADESKKEWKREQERIMKKDAHGRHVL